MATINEESKSDADVIGEADIPSILNYLVDTYVQLDSVDETLIEGGRDKIRQWKEKLTSSIDYYMNFLP